MRWTVLLMCVLTVGCGANEPTAELQRSRKENLRLQQELKSTRLAFASYMQTQEPLFKGLQKSNDLLKSLVALSKERIDGLEKQLQECEKKVADH